MSLTTEMQQKIYESLTDGYNQVKFFQEQVVLLDNDKSGWDQAIFKVDSQLFGEIQIVNNAINDWNPMSDSNPCLVYTGKPQRVAEAGPG